MLYLIKVSNDFIEQPETFQSFLVDVRFGVELFKIWDGRKHDAHQVVGLVIQILRDRKRRGMMYESKKIKQKRKEMENLAQIERDTAFPNTGSVSGKKTAAGIFVSVL